MTVENGEVRVVTGRIARGLELSEQIVTSSKTVAEATARLRGAQDYLRLAAASSSKRARSTRSKSSTVRRK